MAKPRKIDWLSADAEAARLERMADVILLASGEDGSFDLLSDKIDASIFGGEDS